MIATHYAEHCTPPWIALDMDVATKCLAGYEPTEEETSSIQSILESYGRLIDESDLIGYGQTEDEAIAEAKTKAENHDLP